jgi:conjugal transfer mating pair stabilization protein TraG
VNGEVSGGTGAKGQTNKPRRSGAAFGQTGGSLGISTQEAGLTSEIASAQLNVMNFDVRQALANAERSAARSANPTEAFSKRLAEEVLGPNGLRNKYLSEADSARGTADLTAPITSIEQSSLLKSGRFSTDLKNGPFDRNSTFKKSDGAE